MIHAGKELGVSGTGLKKVCIRHEIPFPPQGWWQKLAAGQKLSTPPLQEPSSPKLNSVSIKVPGKSALIHQHAGIADDIEIAPVPDIRPDSIPNWISRIEKHLHRRQVDDRGLIHIHQKSLPRVSVAPQSSDRLIRFLTAFDHTITLLSWTLRPSDDGLMVQIDREQVAFAIEDRLDQKPHSPTSAELAERDNRRRWGLTYMSDTPWPKYDYHASGDLVFVVEGQVKDGLRRRWGDTKRRRIETSLPSIIQSFRAHAAAQIHAREKQAEWHRKFQDEQASRRRKEEARQKNAAFGKFTGDIANLLSEIDRLQRVINHLDRDDEHTPAEARFRDWCIGMIAELKAKIARGALDQAITEIEEGNGYWRRIAPGLFRDS
jgi:hypothetical protein